jgi:methylenetetrahydrofolate dehydrogenase (NADP+)/methenyltetrahydrofolate cyclohydrolase
MAMMLLNINATVTICHSRTKNIKSIISNADLIVGAVGIPKFIQKNWIKNNCIVIDAGYHPDKCGDIDLEGIEERASAFTPVPGGVGPMTINTLILHTLQSAIRAIKV